MNTDPTLIARKSSQRGSSAKGDAFTGASKGRTLKMRLHGIARAFGHVLSWKSERQRFKTSIFSLVRVDKSFSLAPEPGGESAQENLRRKVADVVEFERPDSFRELRRLLECRPEDLEECGRIAIAWLKGQDARGRERALRWLLSVTEERKARVVVKQPYAALEIFAFLDWTPGFASVLRELEKILLARPLDEFAGLRIVALAARFKTLSPQEARSAARVVREALAIVLESGGSRRPITSLLVTAWRQFDADDFFQNAGSFLSRVEDPALTVGLDAIAAALLARDRDAGPPDLPDLQAQVRELWEAYARPEKIEFRRVPNLPGVVATLMALRIALGDDVEDLSCELKDHPLYGRFFYQLAQAPARMLLDEKARASVYSIAKTKIEALEDPIPKQTLLDALSRDREALEYLLRSTSQNLTTGGGERKA